MTVDIAELIIYTIYETLYVEKRQIVYLYYTSIVS